MMLNKELGQEVGKCIKILSLQILEANIRIIIAKLILVGPRCVQCNVDPKFLL
jgi:hypothetical protein